MAAFWSVHVVTDIQVVYPVNDIKDGEDDGK